MNHKTWTPIKQGTLHPSLLAGPLRARKSWRYDIGDVTGAPFESLAAVLGVVAACPGSEFRLMVADPEWMGEFFMWLNSHEAREAERFGIDRGGHMLLCLRMALVNDAPVSIRGAMSWPLPNLTLAVNTPDQPTADRLVPLLLRLPAARREVVLDPLVGNVSLKRWIQRIDHCDSCGAENSPQRPDLCPVCGEEGTLVSTWGHAEAERYRTGERYTTAEGNQDVAGKSPGINRIVVRGETGPNTRPCHPDWIRSLRDQCEEAGVGFVFESWGEWAPPSQVSAAVYDGWYDRIGGDHEKPVWFGRRSTGRLLDGRTHDEEGR